MLDELSIQLLSALDKLAGGGNFSVVEEEDILRLVPANGEEIARRMSYLEDRQFIDIRYAEAGEYCVRVLAAGRGYGATVAREKREVRRERRDLFLAATVGAFAGGALSGCIVLLLSLAV